MIALSKQKSKAPDDQYAKIVDVYTRNKLAFMSRYLEIYYKRTLAGAVLEKADKVIGSRAPAAMPAGRR